MTDSITQSLVDMGVDEEDANNIQNTIPGPDYINLVNAVNEPGIANSHAQVKQILSKYGININEDASMSGNDYLKAMYNTARNGGDISANPVVNEWFAPISESDDLDAAVLARDGYDYFTQIDNKILREKLIDWLEDNSVEYLTNGDGRFNVKCNDRECAYRVGRAISNIMKNVVRDSKNEKEEAVNEKKLSINKLKDKIAAVKPANQAAIAAGKMTGSGVHKSSDPRKKDMFDRKAKHKKNPSNEEIEYTVGQSVTIDESPATIKIPHGPHGTVGVVMDGELKMVHSSDIDRLDERVMGFSQVNPLFRLRELAGLPPAPAVDLMAATNPMEDDLGLDDADLTATDEVPMASNPMASEPVDDMTSVDNSDPMDMQPADAGMDGMGDMDSMGGMGGMGDVDGMDGMDDMPGDLSGGIGMGMPGTPMDTGMPGSLPPTGPEVPMGGVVAGSEAMSQIEDYLNNIQNSLAEIRLSEYKSLVRKLMDLTTQVQSMGRDYLGERRKK